ncbi:MAG: 1-acyl-sn-glycerol-3-phosphate acyltransferase [Oscillospiraceae bacterium]|nr:1-acyl-sn-glycerol-3-phosphate acyltransferase [Oscillospiraceae bacterium]
MDEYRLHRAIYRTVRFWGTPIVRSIYGYSCENLKGIPGPILLLANHNTDMDPGFVGIASGEPIYFVATEKLLRMGLLSPVLINLFHPIIHYKGKAGISSVKEILARLKNNRNVALFPEGNRSFNGLTGDFLSSTGKMARRSGATLVTYRLHGGYFTSPRWSTAMRKGRIRGEIANIYPPEKLKSMTEEEINEAIRKDLYVDAYADQERDRIPYRGKDLALGMESTLFSCPQCGSISSLHSKGDSITCSCGYSAEYDEYGYLHDNRGQTATITQLDALQREKISALAEQVEDILLFEDAVNAETIGPDHKVLSIKKTILRAWRNRLSVGDDVLPFQQITGMAINQRNLLILHLSEGEKHLELSGDISFSALKYLYLYQSARNKNEKI